MPTLLRRSCVVPTFRPTHCPPKIEANYTHRGVYAVRPTKPLPGLVGSASPVLISRDGEQGRGSCRGVRRTLRATSYALLNDQL
jgi:hypothetical protein